MTHDELFDGSDAHLLPGNAALIERLRHNPAIELFAEAADALEAADKRIAEERETYDRLLEEGANKLHEAKRKLAVAREALEDLCDWDGDLVLKDFCEDALAQLGGDDAS